jgi:hypothetical protein
LADENQIIFAPTDDGTKDAGAKNKKEIVDNKPDAFSVATRNQWNSYNMYPVVILLSVEKPVTGEEPALRIVRAAGQNRYIMPASNKPPCKIIDPEILRPEVLRNNTFFTSRKVF